MLYDLGAFIHHGALERDFAHTLTHAIHTHALAFKIAPHGGCDDNVPAGVFAADFLKEPGVYALTALNAVRIDRLQQNDAGKKDSVVVVLGEIVGDEFENVDVGALSVIKTGSVD